ncbi:MAG: zinc ABC transporter substrate-binding protein [Sulfurimonas sp.]|nr:zinc ABC transporter substrate-binding protein [Sulfurimonas sp.]
MLKKIVASALLVCGVSAVAELKVTTTIYPLYSIVKEIGGKKVELNNLIPFGVEAHGFDPTPNDMVKLSKSDIFIVSSDAMEPWKDKIIHSLKIEDKVFDMSKYVKLREAEEEETHGHEHSKGDHKGENIDPHYWVSLNNYIIMTNTISKLIIEKDPQNKEYYEKNRENFLEKVNSLKLKYDISMQTCANKKILVNHDAFGYFADDYSVKQYSISGMTPESKPSAKQIAELIKIAKKEGINTVFFEEFASPKVAQTIAQEAHVKIDSLRPAENISAQENEQGIGYLHIMEENLNKLKFAMGCK